MKLYKKQKQLSFFLALLCLITLQPRIKAEHTELKVIACIAILFGIRPLTYFIGDNLTYIGTVLKNFTGYSKSESTQPTQKNENHQEGESQVFLNLKKAFDLEFKSLQSEQNLMYAGNVYSKIPDISDDAITSKMIQFIQRTDEPAEIETFQKDLFGNWENVVYDQRHLMQAKIKRFKMNEAEYAVYRKTINAECRLQPQEFERIIDYIGTSFWQYRNQIKDRIIGLCAAHTTAELGTEERLTQLDRSASEIITAFHNAVNIRNKSNETSGTVTEVSTPRILCFLNG